MNCRCCNSSESTDRWTIYIYIALKVLRWTIGTVDIALKVLIDELLYCRYSSESTDRSTIGTVDIALKVLIDQL